VDCIIGTNVAPLKGVTGRHSAHSVWQCCARFRPDSPKTGRHVSSSQFVLPKTHRNTITDFPFSRSSGLKHRWQLRTTQNQLIEKSGCRIYVNHNRFGNHLRSSAQLIGLPAWRRSLRKCIRANEPLAEIGRNSWLFSIRFRMLNLRNMIASQLEL
jgi:hypothetical protein